MFSCEFCEISKNKFFTEHLWATGSALSKVSLKDLTVGLDNWMMKDIYYCQTVILYLRGQCTALSM